VTVKRRTRIGLFDVEREQFSMRQGALGIVAVLVAVVFVGAFGYGGIAAVLGAFVTIASAGGGSLRVRVERCAAVAIVGALLTVLGVWSGERGWTAALVVALVTFAGTLVSVYGSGAATAAYLLNLWLLLSLSFTASTHSSAVLATNFLVGGAVAVLLQPLHGRRGRGVEVPGSGAAAPPPNAAPAGDWLSPLRAELRLDSPVFRFAVVRAGGIGGATLLGWYLFDNHPYWAAIIAFAITRSDPAELLRVGVHRAVGAVLGAAAATALVRDVDSRPLLTAALVVAAALGIAFQKANYAIFTFFMTCVIILSTQLVRGNADLAANERAWATLLGVGLAFATTALVLLVARRRALRAEKPVS
jgi:hypothetical protein